MENIARAAKLHDMGTMLKVDFQNRMYIAQKAICSSFQGILFADHHTPDDVRETIRAVKPGRNDADRFGFPNRCYIGTQPYLSQMGHADRLDEVMLAFMIETAQKYNIGIRCEILKPADAEYHIELGVRHFSMGDQLKKLQELWVNDGKKLRERTSLLDP